VLGEFVSDRVERVVVASPGVSVSAAALQLAVDRRIPVVFAYRSGSPYGFLVPSFLSGSVAARRAQFEAYGDVRGVVLARSFVWGKLANQAGLLRFYWKSRRRLDPGLAGLLDECAGEVEGVLVELGGVEGSRVEEVRQDLMALEARGARHYWRGVAALLPGWLGFRGRETRGARDPMNMCLNYGYGLLYGEVWSALLHAGLDPFAGFLHVDRSGRPSLALDLIEEFRQQAVDRSVIPLFTRGSLRQGQVIDAEEGLLSRQARQALVEAVTKRLDQPVTRRRRQLTLRRTILAQARDMARYLLGQSSTYTPFTLKW